MCRLKEVGGVMIHVKERQQLPQTIAIFSHKCVPVGLFARATPVISPLFNFSWALTAHCWELELTLQGRQRGTSHDFGHSMYSLHLAPSHSARKHTVWFSGRVALIVCVIFSYTSVSSLSSQCMSLAERRHCNCW